MDPTLLHLAFLAVAGAAAGILGTAGGITSLIASPAVRGRHPSAVGERH